METNNLWPDFKPADVKTIKSVLKEQAGYLGAKTNSILYAEVKTTSDNDIITHTLTIVAPAVNNYRYKFLEVQHGIDFYPATIIDCDEIRDVVRAEIELINWLRAIFNRSDSIRAINRLLQLSTE